MYSQIITKLKPSIVKVGIIFKQNDLERENFLGLGTGFIVTEEGYIFTCEHVIRPIIENGLNQCLISFETGNFQINPYVSDIIHYDKDKDYAILKIIKEDKFIPIVLGDFNNTNEGEEVLFLGFPLEVTKITTHHAIVSAKGNDLIPPKIINVLQIDGSVNNGNSGGPLVNLKGEVIGIITSKYSEFDRYLKKFLDLGKMTGVSIGNANGRLDIGSTFYNILMLMKSHVNVGIGHAFSIEYAKTKFDTLSKQKTSL